MRSDRELKLWVGWLHLVEGATQDSIAQRLGLTRAKVNRYVAACREEGLIRVSIDTSLRFCFEAERELMARYGLPACYIVPTPAEREGTASVVGAAAGAFVSAQLQPRQTLALGWGRTLDASVRGLEPRSAAGNVIVGLMGGLARAGSINPYDIAARFARKLDAACYYLIAPIVAESVQAAESFRSMQMVRDVLARAAAAEHALVGAGDLRQTSMDLSTGVLGPRDQQRLERAGAVGNVFGIYLSADGQVVDDEVNTRRVQLDPAAIRRIPNRMVAAGGPEKVAILRAALVSGLCTSLISDLETARQLLDE
ncbi:winged helix-turn-helix transcriptional regulator [Pseudoroseomonas wenyumeiae]|uniref:Winged helix-turn-helix transcriptional regulator n=1 Tax=Teichococcus wenyumeiae TaxID=2478470 RepID=A0A3A9JKV9_9PROT|nr:sugar-binding domain-containing protein [Pseudoroseomonas wenyumeiae]RKK05195.1 winged helix-turn-helix transcriptional regulator [Pseudoroseomonas wenyumeiae]RMI17580.1 winged helix-turn-helix transcriptional regulator [Pseudoroseomonas wenyumeiae]